MVKTDAAMQVVTKADSDVHGWVRSVDNAWIEIFTGREFIAIPKAEIIKIKGSHKFQGKDRPELAKRGDS
ncbi:MAG: hypothetical protein AAF902_02005 [Chloroflexota bacterium]